MNEHGVVMQDGGSRQLGVTPSKASWTALLKWGSKQLPFVRRDWEQDAQPDQVSNPLPLTNRYEPYPLTVGQAL